jgi:lipopolysaccharide heptosyltransferase II
MTKPRIIVVAPNWLGDAVMALPAIRDVRRHFAEAQLVVTARSSVAMLFRAVPGVDEIAEPGKSGGDVGILLPNSFRSAWELRRAGVPERWGYRSDMRGMLLTKPIKRPRKKVHFGEYYQHLVQQLGIDTGPLTPQLTVPEGKVRAAADLLAQRGWTPGQALIAIAPGAAFGHAKRWPPERFAALASMLRAELGAACVLVGRSEDRDDSVRAGGTENIGGIDLIGQTDLSMLMGVLLHCRALVANDSGALHLAAALGVPVTAIYGPTDERYSLPLSSFESPGDRVRAISRDVFCRPCGLRDCPIDHRCMKRITTQEVFELVRRQLQG